MTITQIKSFPNDWTLEIRFGSRRKIYKWRFKSDVLFMTFYSEESALTWANKNGIINNQTNEEK